MASAADQPEQEASLPMLALMPPEDAGSLGYAGQVSTTRLKFAEPRRARGPGEEEVLQ